MAHNEQNFQLHAGNDRDITITCTTSDGVDLDLSASGLTITWILLNHPLSVNPLISKTSPTEIDLPSPLTNQYVLHLVAADTVTVSPFAYIVPPGVYYHGSVLEDANGNRTTLLHGTVEISPGYLP